ncbi:hypothetical protein ACI65C_000086 [Semiaphis heraclei]
MERITYFSTFILVSFGCSKYPKSVWYVIGNEFCERFSYFGLKVCAYLSPLFGAIIADSYWGKYKTIFILSIVHAIGNILVAVASFVTSISLNFQRYGSLLSTFITPELRKSVHCFGKDSCFPLAFGVPAILMLISIVFFVSGKNLYKIKKPVSSITTTSIGCMFGQTLTLAPNEGQLRIYNNFDCGVAMSSSLIGNFSIEPFDALRINYSTTVFNESDVLSIDVNPTCQLLKTVKTSNLKQRVFIVKGRVSSYLLTFKNNDGIELKHLNELRKLRSGNSNLRIFYSDNLSGKNITLRNTNNKLSDINNFQVSLNKNTNHEIPVGTYDVYIDNKHVLLTADLLPASVNELIFHQRFNHTNVKLITLENGKYIHILWQVPQTLLITIAEVMVVVPLLEFTFTQAPLSMKSFISAVNLCTQAVGNLLIVLISKMKLFENQVHEYIFYVVLVVLGVIIFMLMSAKYKYKYVTDNQYKE